MPINIFFLILINISKNTNNNNYNKITSMVKRVLFVLSSHEDLGNTGKKTGWFLAEAAHPYHALTEKGILVDFAR